MALTDRVFTSTQIWTCLFPQVCSLGAKIPCPSSGFTPRTDISRQLSVLTKHRMYHHISQESERHRLFLSLGVLLAVSDRKPNPLWYMQKGEFGNFYNGVV